jgi:hypothetical protein
MATFIELGSIRSLPRFEWYTQRVHRQLGRTPGLIGYSFCGQFPLRYWPLSALENGRALNGFVKAGKHRTVMTSLLPSMRDFGQAHWNVTGAALPLSWADGLATPDRVAHRWRGDRPRTVGLAQPPGSWPGLP